MCEPLAGVAENDCDSRLLDEDERSGTMALADSGNIVRYIIAPTSLTDVSLPVTTQEMQKVSDASQCKVRKRITGADDLSSTIIQQQVIFAQLTVIIIQTL